MKRGLLKAQHRQRLSKVQKDCSAGGTSFRSASNGSSGSEAAAAEEEVADLPQVKHCIRELQEYIDSQSDIQKAEERV